jgi:tetratricopeptide (TPR) repeat protein
VLQRAHELNPLEPVINVNLAALLAAGGEREAARAQLERVLAITPDDPLLLRSLANIEFNAGDFARALPPARRAVQIDPAAPTSVSTLVQILNALEAFEESSAVLAHLPETSPYRMSLAQGMNLQQGRAELAPGLAEHVEGLMQGFGSVIPQDRELIVNAALAQLETKPREAVRLLRRVVPEPAAIEGDGNLLDAASALVTALQRAGLETEAEPYYQALDQTAERLLDGAPDTAQFAFSRGMMAEYRGERDAALAQFARAIELGWRHRWILRHDPRLAALRSDPRWLELDARLSEVLAEARREARLSP